MLDFVTCYWSSRFFHSIKVQFSSFQVGKEQSAGSLPGHKNPLIYAGSYWVTSHGQAPIPFDFVVLTPLRVLRWLLSAWTFTFFVAGSHPCYQHTGLCAEHPFRGCSGWTLHPTGAWAGSSEERNPSRTTLPPTPDPPEREARSRWEQQISPGLICQDPDGV